MGFVSTLTFAPWGWGFVALLVVAVFAKILKSSKESTDRL